MKKKIGILACIALVLVTTIGCWGPMSLSRGFDDWTNQLYVDTPWLAQLLFYISIIPAVWLVASAIDLLIVNVLDFWGESAFRGTGTPYIHRNPAVPEPR